MSLQLFWLLVNKYPERFLIRILPTGFRKVTRLDFVLRYDSEEGEIVVEGGYLGSCLPEEFTDENTPENILLSIPEKFREKSKRLNIL